MRNKVKSTDDRARAVGGPDWAALVPVGVVAFGPASSPVERIPETQAAVYRLMVWLGRPHMPRLARSSRGTHVRRAIKPARGSA